MRGCMRERSVTPHQRTGNGGTLASMGPGVCQTGPNLARFRSSLVLDGPFGHAITPHPVNQRILRVRAKDRALCTDDGCSLALTRKWSRVFRCRPVLRNGRAPTNCPRAGQVKLRSAAFGGNSRSRSRARCASCTSRVHELCNRSQLSRGLTPKFPLKHAQHRCPAPMACFGQKSRTLLAAPRDVGIRR